MSYIYLNIYLFVARFIIYINQIIFKTFNFKNRSEKVSFLVQINLWQYKKYIFFCCKMIQNKMFLQKTVFKKSNSLCYYIQYYFIIITIIIILKNVLKSYMVIWGNLILSYLFGITSILYININELDIIKLIS